MFLFYLRRTSLMCTNVMAEWTKLENTLDAKTVVYADIGKIRNKGMSKEKRKYCGKWLVISKV